MVLQLGSTSPSINSGHAYHGSIGTVEREGRMVLCCGGWLGGGEIVHVNTFTKHLLDSDNYS